MKNVSIIIVAITIVFAASCKKTDELKPQVMASNNTVASARSPIPVNGIESTIPAYFDGRIYNLHIAEFTTTAADMLITHNRRINTIYRFDNRLPNGKPFISVISAIQGEGFAPIWKEVQIIFKPRVTPHQFVSSVEILAAARGDRPEITLNLNEKVYHGAVVTHIFDRN